MENKNLIEPGISIEDVKNGFPIGTAVIVRGVAFTRTSSKPFIQAGKVVIKLEDLFEPYAIEEVRVASPEELERQPAEDAGPEEPSVKVER